ncbi:MAG: hypothetical protein B6U69_03120 [Thermofilum sp. ex4484_15]|nr:MAG: hypothetical protein B6U69_03120 [Thermofilum sp. ex4484_15]
MVLSLYPLYLIVYLKCSKSILGLIDGISEAISYFLRPISGKLSDKVGKRKSLALLGYLISNISKPLLALTSTWGQVLLVRVADRIGKGIRTAPRDALLSSSVNEREAGRAFGLHRTLDQAGAVIGPLIATALVTLMDLRKVFLASLLPGSTALIVLYLLVREVEVRKANIIGLDTKTVSGRLKLVLTSLALLYLATFTPSFILVGAREANLSTSLIPLIYALLNFLHASLGLPIGALTDRVGGERALIVGYFFITLTSLIALLSPFNFISIMIVASTYGCYLGVLDTVPRALIPTYVPPSRRGTVYGIYYLLAGISSFVGNSLFGYLWSSRGVKAAFGYSLSLSLLSLTILIFTLVNKRDPHQ